MYLHHLLRISHPRIMTFCFINLFLIFGISCSDLITQQSNSSNSKMERPSTIPPILRTPITQQSNSSDSKMERSKTMKPILTTPASLKTTSSLQHSNLCTIKFYNRNDYQGDKIAIYNSNGISNLEMIEKSAQTFGRCCWKIYR